MDSSAYRCRDVVVVLVAVGQGITNATTCNGDGEQSSNTIAIAITVDVDIDINSRALVEVKAIIIMDFCSNLTLQESGALSLICYNVQQ
jgi:hypothetical protein